MNKIVMIGIIGLLLFGFVGASYCLIEEEHKEEINRERQSYNNLLRKYVEKNPYKLGDDLMPIKLMKQ